MNTTSSRKGLSKSRYTLFRQCAKALWLNAYKPEEAVIDPSLQARFEAGNEVGDLAMGYLGPFTKVTSFDENGRLDLKEMIRKTAECIDAGVENIAEASFSWEGNYCAVDILHRQDGGHAIYEVKSSSGTPSQSETDEEYVKYARDIAYQKYVLEKSGVKVTGTYLIRINKDYVRGDELDIHSFFYHVDLHELVNQESLVIEENIGKARETLASESEPEIPIGTHCQDPYGCAFWQYCTRDVPHPSVFNLYRMPFGDKIELFNKGKVTFEQLRGEALSDKQHTQVECTLTGARHINPDGIKEWLDTLSYPLYFLDFETMQSVVPQYHGTRPYQQVTFQYSLHYIETEGGELKHKEFLGISGEDPRRALAEQLCADIPMDVCTMAYNKSFECGRIRELAEAFPDLAEHLLNIESHIVDLIDPFRAGHCYLPAMDGSFSIKKVLPALFPEAPELDYHNLSGGVQNGGDAMTIFPRIKDMSPEDQSKARCALLDYCCLDTYAMVKVWGKLIEFTK